MSAAGAGPASGPNRVGQAVGRAIVGFVAFLGRITTGASRLKAGAPARLAGVSRWWSRLSERGRGLVEDTTALAARLPRPDGPKGTGPKGTRKGKRKRSFIWRLRRVAFGIALLGIAAVSGFAYVLSKIPLPTIETPIETTFLLDASGAKLAELSPPGAENRVLTTLDKVSPTMVDALLSAEDRDFFSHPGVNVSAILRATIADLRGQPIQGGSTITQQYVKLELVGTDVTLIRKIREATLAVKLEQKLSKREILERYLNTVYFGRNAYGIQAAARAYFFIDADKLDVGQSALLAGLIRAPESAEPSTAPEEATNRRNNVLAEMVAAGKITEATEKAAVAVPIQELVRPRADVSKDQYVGAEFGTQYIVESIRRTLPALGFSDEEINGGGLRVHTTIDMRLQAAAYQAVYGTLDQPGDPSGALVSVDDTGAVRAMVGGRDWNALEPWARVNLATGSLGGGTGRQAGSSFKPFALATALADGYSLASPFEAPSSVIIPKADAGKDYKVSNYGGESFGQLDLLQATTHSVNTAYAQLIEAIGPSRVADMAHRLGITAKINPTMSIVLGTPSVSVLDMADAYLTFATRGLHVAPTLITSVTDAHGKVLWQNTAAATRVLEQDTADRVTTALESVVTSGTGTRARVGVPIAGKTGTTEHYGDAWFVGYTPKLSTAVWMGFPQGQDTPMSRVHGISVTGGTLPAQAWHNYMVEVIKDPQWVADFVAPADVDAGRLLKTVDHSVPADASTGASTTPDGTPG
jgi:penicillin-binding protein 1A